MRAPQSRLLLAGLLILPLLAFPVHAGGKVSGGVSLLEPASAKFSALAGASTAAQDEISSLNENPATLQSLKSGQALFLYQKGMLDESFGRFMVGAPLKKGALGLSVAYFNGGDIDVADGAGARTVSAQKDLTLTLGGSRELGQFELGLAGKYFRSELVDAYQATAFAADLGLAFNASSRLRLGAAMQNFGTQVTYLNQGDDLPRIARAGGSYELRPGRNYPTMLYLDAPYYLNEQELQPALGLEVMFGPLAMRAGYRHRSGGGEFTMGTGFMITKMTLDYSFGMQKNLDTVQRFSLSMRFGSGSSLPMLVKKPEVEQQQRVVTALPAAPGARVTTEPTKRSPARRVYVVQPGDTLATIAKKEYGTTKNWSLIFYANKHLLDDPRAIEVGQKLVLP